MVAIELLHDLLELRQRLVVTLQGKEAFANLKPAARTHLASLSAAYRGRLPVIPHRFLVLALHLQRPGQAELCARGPLALRICLEKIDISCLGICPAPRQPLRLTQPHHRRLAQDRLGHVAYLLEVPAGEDHLAQPHLALAGLEQDRRPRVGVGELRYPLLKQPGAFLVVAVATVNQCQPRQDLLARLRVIVLRQHLFQLGDRLVEPLRVGRVFRQLEPDLLDEIAVRVVLEQPLVLLDRLVLAVDRLFAPGPFVQRLVGELRFGRLVDHALEVVHGVPVVAQPGQRDPTRVGCERLLLVVRVELQ